VKKGLERGVECDGGEGLVPPSPIQVQVANNGAEALETFKSPHQCMIECVRT
jgi:hypothetical protein